MTEEPRRKTRPNFARALFLGMILDVIYVSIMNHEPEEKTIDA